ncbi:MAG: ABC transporter ATP-binding protein [Firmicutes bacterium]|nr:ABC transporter ATP-binding protein [Bacillota bacterium]
MISMQKIDKSFGNKQVLNQISFEIPRETIFGLLGPSGSGKTTIINILTEQIAPNAGVSRVDAQPFEIGLMLDDDGLYERLTVANNLKIFATIYGLPNNAGLDIARSVELDGEMNTPVNKLSRGMRSRVALARAVIHKPKVLFLDEPTSNLDPVTARKIHGLIRNLREAGTTIFLTTHNMQEAVDLCDTIALLSQGKVIEQGDPKEICKKHNSYKTIPDLESVFVNLTGIKLD